MVALRLHNPTSGPQPGTTKMAQRSRQLAGKRVGLLNNGKRNSDVVLQIVAHALKERFDVGEVVEFKKSSAYKPAAHELLDEVAKECRLVVTGVGD